MTKAQHSANLTSQLNQTDLFDIHMKYDAKMVEFAGYNMPIQYTNTGIVKEHLHTRNSAGLFDVSHMGQAFLTSENSDPAIYLEKIVPSSIINLKPNHLRYTVLLNEDGGIIDDLMVTRIDENTLYLVVNAGCKDGDYKFIEKMIGQDVTLTPIEDRALIALQGPKACDVLRQYYPACDDLTFMTSAEASINHIDCMISRSGYSGEDGFEISIANEDIAEFTEILLKDDRVMLIGLGARDTLRLEAGLCLYGHDIDTETTPIEANLKWAIQKRRREDGGFPAYDKIIDQINNGTEKLRVGLKPETRAPLREGVELFDLNNNPIGKITSGGFSPTIESPIAMGYVTTDFSQIDTKIQAQLRGKMHPCTVVKMPFIQPNYKR